MLAALARPGRKSTARFRPLLHPGAKGLLLFRSSSIARGPRRPREPPRFIDSRRPQLIVSQFLTVKYERSRLPPGEYSSPWRIWKRQASQERPAFVGEQFRGSLSDVARGDAGVPGRRFFLAPAIGLGGCGRTDSGGVQSDDRPGRPDFPGSRAFEHDGRPGWAAEAAYVAARSDRTMGDESRLHQYAHRRSRAAHRRNRAHDRRGGQGRPRAVHGTGGGWARPQGGISSLGETRQYDDRAAFGVHVGSDPRGAGSRHRG